MKIDRKFFEKFEDKVKATPEVRACYDRGDIKGAEEIVVTSLFNKPEDFFNLDKLRKSMQIDRRITLREFGRLADNPRVSLADVRALDEWREVIPEYVKDYVSLNQFVA